MAESEVEMPGERILEKFFIKVNNDLVYSSSGNYKNMKELHTLNSILYPKYNLDKFIHPVLKTIGNNPNAFRQIYSTDTSSFVNSLEAVDFVFDDLKDAVSPVVSNRLYKAGKDYPVMNPYMVELLDFFATTSPKTKVELEDGIYNFNRYGCTNNTTLKNVGIIEIQGAGGGSGGTNNVSADCAGGGGGAGGYAIIYYRIKNIGVKVTMTVEKGLGGSEGGAGSGNGGDGTTSYVNFKINDDENLVFVIAASGGFGGATGNYNYTNGGDGGKVAFIDNSKGVSDICSGGLGGTSARWPSSGSVVEGQVLLDNKYLFVYLLAAQGGAGGGRGDDTDGTCQGQSGAGTLEMNYKIPNSKGTAKTITLSAQYGGGVGANVSDSAPGGGGASVLASGANGGAKNTVGNPGTLGSGAGGAGCGNNANRPGSRGGDGIINLYI